MKDFSLTDINEVYRYMGFKGESPEPHISEMTIQVVKEIADSASPKFCAVDTSISINEENVVLDKQEKLDVSELISLTDANGNELDTSLCTFSLRSRDESVVLVNDMTITAQNEGSTSVRIIVYCGNVSRSVNLRVTVNQDIDASFAFETVSSEAIFENLVVESANEIEF